MVRALTLTLLVCLVIVPDDASAQSRRYPRVYGFTGRPYGPTQAHYQYEKQYGKPWHGYRGLQSNYAPINNRRFVGGNGFLPFGYQAYFNGGCRGNFGGFAVPFSAFGGVTGPPGFADFGPTYSYIPMAPLVLQGHPQFIGPNPFDNEVLRGTRLENELRLNAIRGALNTRPERIITPSTAAAKQKSLHAQKAGDTWFRKQEYHKAIDRYKTAVSEAEDRGAAHARLAAAYAAIGRFDRAVERIKLGTQSDPDFARKLGTFEKLLGEENKIAKSALMSSATRWTKEDIRDPDRLLLLGMLCRMDGKPDYAKILLDTGLTLSGGAGHFEVMLASAPPVVIQAAPSSSDDGPELKKPAIPIPAPDPAPPVPTPLPGI